MTKESQVCRLEQAKRLKELGIEQSALFAYMQWDETPMVLLPINYYDDNAPDTNYHNYMGAVNEDYSAFSVAELGVMLPSLGFEYVKSNDGKGKDFFWASSNYHKAKGMKFDSYSEAEMKADMLIYALQSGMITAQECNERITK